MSKAVTYNSMTYAPYIFLALSFPSLRFAALLSSFFLALNEIYVHLHFCFAKKKLCKRCTIFAYVVLENLGNFRRPTLRRKKIYRMPIKF